MENKDIWQHTSSIMQRCVWIKHNQEIDERQNSPLPHEKWIGTTKNYRGITFTSIAAKVYNALFLNRIKLEIEKIIRKN